MLSHDDDDDGGGGGGGILFKVKLKGKLVDMCIF